MKAYQNLKYVDNLVKGKHQKSHLLIPSRLRCVCLAQCLILYGPVPISGGAGTTAVWVWGEESVEFGSRPCYITRRTLHKAVKREEGVAERVQHPFSTPYPNNPYPSEMPLPQDHGAAPPSSPVVRVMRYGDKQLAHSKVRRGISSLLVFRDAFLHQGNKAAGHGKKWTALIWAIQHIFLHKDWFGNDS